MKKSTAVLIAALSFLAGVTGGALIGFALAPIKKGLSIKISLNNCGNKYQKKSKKKKNKNAEKFSAALKERAALPAAASKRETKGSKKWIGRK